MAEPTRDAPPSVRPIEDRLNDRLDSWKEIAAYLNRDVTTVQRWEKREGMPVHRHLHDRMGSVYASRAELDAWVNGRNLRATQENGNPVGPPAAVETNENASPVSSDRNVPIIPVTPQSGRRPWTAIIAICGCVLLLSAGWFVYKRWRVIYPAPLVQRALTRLTSDDGLQTGATWSPDGRFIAYSSDRGGKYDIWVRQISGGDPIQITKGPAENWQPDWSPDGKYIAYRSEEGDGGIYITPALGGTGLQRKISFFGYFPRWSPDSSRILFQTGSDLIGGYLYAVGLDGKQPRPVLTDLGENRIPMFATWHPDGKRITTWIFDGTTLVGTGSPIPSFLTEPIYGGPAIESKITPELRKQVEAALAPGVAEWRTDFRFAWAPSGKAVYYERTFRGARNIWRMSVDPVTLQPTRVERLTTSPGPDTELSVSPDGSKIAFTSERQQIRAWAFPFDAHRGRVTGSGQPITSPGIEAWSLNLSRDGKKLSVDGSRDGHLGHWATTVPNGREESFGADDSYIRGLPIWSPDGKHAIYGRWQSASDKVQIVGEVQLVVWSSDQRSEDPVEGWSSPFGGVTDWSPDGQSVLVTHWASLTARPSIWQLFVHPSLSRVSSAREMTSDPNYQLYQAHFSPDGRWIVFEGVKENSNSIIFAIPAAGGPWIRITDGKHWDDKPRWSPDGRTIYYLSERKGSLNVWGVHFDPVKGRPQGEPFQVTSFETPTLMIPKNITLVQFSLTDGRLVLPMAQASGNIWTLDNVDR